MFASQSGTVEKSVSVATPFHKYTTVAPLDTHSESSDSESDSEVYQLDDSGYHKNKMAMVSVLNKSRYFLSTLLFSTAFILMHLAYHYKRIVTICLWICLPMN